MNLTKVMPSGTSPIKKKKKSSFLTKELDAPEENQGVFIKNPDMIKQDPRDYLLIGRVLLKKQRPLTEAEIKHKQREALLEKLNYEIKMLQMQAGYERKVNTIVKGLKGLS